MKVIPFSKMPKRDYSLAARFNLDFDQIARRLNAQPKLESFGEEGSAFPHRYRDIYLQLNTGRYASLTQTEMRQSTVEIGLEIKKDRFFHEVDLIEIVRELQIDMELVNKLRGDITWIPAKEYRRMQ
jgi:hypothetical protein